MEGCDLDSVEARETIKQALASQVDLSGTMRKDGRISGNREGEDHSFNHFVDYRAIGEYESH
jgi:hypothetical protein